MPNPRAKGHISAAPFVVALPKENRYSYDPEKARKKFFDKTVPLPETGCLLWLGSVLVHGRGQVKVHGFETSAHRMAWLLAGRDIPEGIGVLHKCDVPLCVNVDHLFLGTQTDNMQDCSSKGRNRKGEKSHFAKLTADDVASIRASSELHRVLAARFGVCRQTIDKIKREELWRSS